MALLSTTTTLTVSPQNPTPGQTVTLTATVTTTGVTIDSGSVDFRDNGSLLATVAVDGTGTAVFESTFALGSHNFTAEYTGYTAPVVPPPSDRYEILPTGWYDSEYATSNPGAFTIHPDVDGHSVWAFEYFANKVKRIDLDTRQVTVDWTYPYYSNVPTCEDGTAFWLQDSQGFVYTFDGYPSSSNSKNLKKLNPANGMAEVASLNFPVGTIAYTPEDYRVYQLGGKDYAVLIDNRTPAHAVIVNLTDMSFTLTTTLTGHGTSEKGWACFVDKNNDVWFVTAAGSPTVRNFYKSTQNAAPVYQWQILSTAFTTGAVFAFCTYDSTTHSAFVGTSKYYSGDMVMVSLATGTVTATKLDNLTNFYNGTLDAPLSCMRRGFQNGQLAVPGDTNLDERGGTVNIIDPSLNIVETLDLTRSFVANQLSALQNSQGVSWKGVYNPATTYHYGDAVQGSNGVGYIRMTTGTSDPVTEQAAADANNGYDAFTNWVPVVTNKQRDGSDLVNTIAVSSGVVTVTTRSTTNPYYVGQQITIYGINTVGGATFLNGQTLTIATASAVVGNACTLTANLPGAPDYAVKSNNGSINRKMYPPFSNLVWLASRKQFVWAYEYVGSPVYVFTVAPPAQPQPPSFDLSSDQETTVVSEIVTSMTITSETPTSFEDEVTFLVTLVSGSGTPTGSVRITDELDGVVTELATLTLLDGNASYTTNALAPGAHVITAEYLGEGFFLPATATQLQQVLEVVPANGILPGFALMATYNEQGDSALPPSATLAAVPAKVTAHKSVYLLWETVNITKIRITANNGVDPAIDTGKISTVGSGLYEVKNGFSTTTMVTMSAFDNTGKAVITTTVKVTVL